MARYDDGLIKICQLKNIAKNGLMPVYQLNLKSEHCFSEKQIGINRVYLAKGVDEQIDMVVEIQAEVYRPKIEDYAILTNYDGQESDGGDQYRIKVVQPTFNDDGLKVYILTLSKIGENYDVFN